MDEMPRGLSEISPWDTKQSPSKAEGEPGDHILSDDFLHLYILSRRSRACDSLSWNYYLLAARSYKNQEDCVNFVPDFQIYRIAALVTTIMTSRSDHQFINGACYSFSIEHNDN